LESGSGRQRLRNLAEARNEVLRRISFWTAVALAVHVLLAGRAGADELVEYHSIHDIESLFAMYHYTAREWRSGMHVVPRIYLDDVPTSWRATHAKRIPTPEKKSLFFRVLAPIVLYVNERILEDRSQLEGVLARQAAGEELSAEDRDWLRDLAMDYEIPGAGSAPLDAAFGAELLRRVDAIPPSLALAQGAVESGWGTSRFADVGNSLFGQWSWSGGIEPEQQRTETHGNHRIAAFRTTSLSAASYAHNLNTHDAYAAFRAQRDEMRRHGSLPHGSSVVSGMVRYSERGEAYVHELQMIMRQNHLDAIDDAMLLEMHVIRLEPGE
jgi:uncharacterized FlgJ-related protein